MTDKMNRHNGLIVPRKIFMEGRWVMYYVFSSNDEPAFHNRFFEFAGYFTNGYAPIGVGDSITHIDRKGKIVHGYFFADAGKVDQYGVVRVKRCANSPWRCFDLQYGEFTD